MKKVFLFAAMLAIAASCTVSEIDSIKGTTAPEITASYENNGTKTTIITDEEGVGIIWWKPADEINVFYGTTSTHYVSKNKENATTVAFGTTDIIGSTESAQENIWGLYPYNENAVCDGESVTTTIPAVQQAIAGSFDDDIFTSLAHSTSTVMTFYNVLGGIKFSLSRDDIQTITFKGNNDEDIAGKVKLEMDANGKPVAEITEGEKTITLTPKEGTTFASGTNYYIVMLPTVLSNGFTMTFETETEIGTFEYTAKSIEIKRSVFSKKENIDTYAEFDSSIPEGLVDMGLSVLWASYDLGANAPGGLGKFFSWGETETKTTPYEWDNYLWYDVSNEKLTKYNIIQAYGKVDNMILLEPNDDIAFVTYGEGWRIPTVDEWFELQENCDFSYDSEIHGWIVRSKITNNFIYFINAAYWSSTLDTSFPKDAFSFALNYQRVQRNDRCEACFIHPVFVNEAYKSRTLVEIEGQGPTTISAGWKTCFKSPDADLFYEDKMGNNLIGDSSALATWKAEGGQGYLAPITFEYVDLGLSVKWATCNIGATAPEKTGNLYAWGETKPKMSYISYNYKWYNNGNKSYITKYNNFSTGGIVDNKTVLDAEDDAACVNLGGSWRMPTKKEFNELINTSNCTWTWTKINKVYGYKITSRKAGYTDKWIFIPASGYYGISPSSAGLGSYWTSELTIETWMESSTSGCHLWFSDGSISFARTDREFGMPIRPVFK